MRFIEPSFVLAVSQVAKESALQFCPSANITAYHDSIMKQVSVYLQFYHTEVQMWDWSWFAFSRTALTTTWSSSESSCSWWTLWITEVSSPDSITFFYSQHLQTGSIKTFVASPAARNHVNRMCLAADIPLIESGTAGYLGQVTIIKKVAHTPFFFFFVCS